MEDITGDGGVLKEVSALMYKELVLFYSKCSEFIPHSALYP